MHAAERDDEILFLVDYKLNESIWIKSFDDLFADYHRNLIEDAVSDCTFAYEEMGFSKPAFNIHIIFQNIPDFLTSYSVFIRPESFFEVSTPTYRIYIDTDLSPEDLEAHIAHELFHAYQEETLTGPWYLIPQDGAETDWLREATAMWAIDQVYPDNNYELDFVEEIYKNPMVNYYAFGDFDAYTWYQMFFYFTEILDTSGDGTYAKRLFDSYKRNMNLNAAFEEVHGGRERFNLDFAKFGMALFGGVKPHLSFESAEPSYPYFEMEIGDENIHQISEIIKSTEDDWDECSFSSPGFCYKAVKIPADYTGLLIFQQNLSMEKKEQMTGMRIAARRNGEWKWENILIEPAMHVVDIGDSLDAIDEVVVMFFNANFKGFEKSRFRIAEGVGQEAKGTVIIKWEKIFNPTEGGESEKENYTFVISEELKKSSAIASGQSGRNMDENVTNEDVGYLISGERYIVERLEADAVYSYFYKKDKTEKKIIGNGRYVYEGKSRKDGGSREIPELPDIPGISGSAPGLSGEAVKALDKMKEALDKAKGELGDMSGFVPDVPEIEGGGQSGGNGDSSNISDIFKAILPQELQAGIPRVVRRPESGVFELLPTLPPDIETLEWVEYEYVYKYPDPENATKMKEESGSYTDAPGQILPLWFVNPDYTENISSDYSEPLDFSDTEDFAKRLMSVQSLFNKYNIQKLINDPWMPFEVDFKHEIQPEPESAVLTEKAAFSGKKLEAELTAKTITKKGNIINITISVQYDFK